MMKSPFAVRSRAYPINGKVHERWSSRAPKQRLLTYNYACPIELKLE